MRSIGVIRHYRHFRKGVAPAAIPVSGVRYPCIPHPFATIIHSSYPLRMTVRLACLSHAASVRSEPGSNSSLFYLCSADAPRKVAARMQMCLGSHLRVRESESRLNFRRNSTTACVRLRARHSIHKTCSTRVPPNQTRQQLGRHTFTTSNLFTCQRALVTELCGEPGILSGPATLSSDLLPRKF